MADRRRNTGACNDTCGCPSPCPGGQACRCTPSSETSTWEDPNMEHMRCSCGDHCGCNPCTCTKTGISGAGKAFCKCAEGCTCATCGS
ncbi:hypothetical protein HHK36_008807 [Tetracentron sinense]|uniref:Metallothionein n=1 Tax=Tetracentron sinense TaxID=13715 RepID=A0A834ZG59_TETSI|nr:hypothetical protein HHK36_008807 [Tetracentron sinense]